MQLVQSFTETLNHVGEYNGWNGWTSAAGNGVWSGDGAKISATGADLFTKTLTRGSIADGRFEFVSPASGYTPTAVAGAAYTAVVRKTGGNHYAIYYYAAIGSLVLARVIAGAVTNVATLNVLSATTPAAWKMVVETNGTAIQVFLYETPYDNLIGTLLYNDTSGSAITAAGAYGVCAFGVNTWSSITAWTPTGANPLHAIHVDGDSRTRGAGVTLASGTFSHVAQATLAGLKPTESVDLVQYGIGGSSTAAWVTGATAALAGLGNANAFTVAKQAISLFADKATIVMASQINDAVAELSPATYQANLTNWAAAWDTWMTTGRPAATGLPAIPYRIVFNESPGSEIVGGGFDKATINPRMEALSPILNVVQALDSTKRKPGARPYALFQAHPLLLTTSPADGVHFSNTPSPLDGFVGAGHGELGRLTGQALFDAWDSTAPTVTSATVTASGTVLTVQTSETTTGSAGFSLLLDGVPVTGTWARTAGTTLTLTLAGTNVVQWGQTATLSYAPGNIADGAGNAMGAFSGMGVALTSVAAPLWKATLAKLETMLESDGAGGWRFEASALSQVVAQVVAGIGASAYPATWPRTATSAAIELAIAGATSSGRCGCKQASPCGCSHGSHATLYEGDTRERVFFLRDAGKSVVALPLGVSVEVWDDDAKVADATVTVSDPARWSGVISLESVAWGSLPPGNYWLRVLDGDGQVVTVQALTTLAAGAVR